MNDPKLNLNTSEHEDLTLMLPGESEAVLLRERNSQKLMVAGGVRYAFATIGELQDALRDHRQTYGFFSMRFDDDQLFCWMPQWLSIQDESGSHAQGSLPDFYVDEPANDLPQMHQVIFVPRSEWRAGVKRVQQEIRVGNVRKVVLSRWAQAQSSGRISIAHSANRLLAQNNDTTTYVLRSGKETWLGATPEMLFHRNENELRVDSMAGTLRESSSRESGFNSKELLEQELVTEFVTNELRELATEINVSPIQQRGASGLLHAHAEIRAKLNDNISDDELIARLHPTPAVCGVPREKSKKLIREIEQVPRGYYSGVVGWTDGKTTTAWVMLRCAMLNGMNAEFFGGAGIVEQSDADDEYDECGWKMETAYRAIFGMTLDLNFPDKLS